MISTKKVALKDLLKRADTKFPNDEKVFELNENFGRLFKEVVFPEDLQAHLDDFVNNDGGGDNDDDGFDNVEKERSSLVNVEKNGVNAKKEESNEQVSLLRRMRFNIAIKILFHELNVHAKKMFDLADKFEIENDEQTRIWIIVDAIKNRAERDPAKTKTVVENQEEDAMKIK
nr:peptidase C48, SUMO/sentrin/Ubl1 [Tanacetum cinerariifolium]